MAHIDSVREKREEFLFDDYAVMKSWYGRRKQFSNFVCSSCRVFTTPVSSASSERVFSTLKLIVDEKRSRVNFPLIDDMIVVRSLHE